MNFRELETALSRANSLEIEQLTIMLIAEFNGQDREEEADRIRDRMELYFDGLTSERKDDFNICTVAVYELFDNYRKDLELANKDGEPTQLDIDEALRNDDFTKAVDLVTRIPSYPAIPKWALLAQMMELMEFPFVAILAHKKLAQAREELAEKSSKSQYIQTAAHILRSERARTAFFNHGKATSPVYWAEFLEGLVKEQD